MRGLHLWVGVLAVVGCLIVAVAAVDEGAVALNGDDAAEGWVSDLGESEGAPPSALSSSSSAAAMATSVAMTYVLNSPGKSGLKELMGQELMGEAADDDKTASLVRLSDVQGALEANSDMMGRISRLNAMKLLMAMPAPVSFEESTLALVETGSGVMWGRRRRNASWEKKNAKVLKPKPKPQPKVVVKKKLVQAAKKAAEKPKKPVSMVDEAKNKADKAITMAEEKGQKARKKAELEAKAASKEASDKQKFEKAEKRKHEITKKEEAQREKQMKRETERSDKKAKEAAHKAEQLSKAVAKAREAAKKEGIMEKKMKKGLEMKLKKVRKHAVIVAKEKAAKRTREVAQKRMAEIKAKFEGEGIPKKAEEIKLKRINERKKKKHAEKTKKKVGELARKTAREAKNKNAEEKALKLKNEKRIKKELERNSKAEKERAEKAKEEVAMKVKREKALKAAAKRRIDEEKRGKADKKKAIATANEVQKKKGEEMHQKANVEQSQKLKAEGEQKKATEKREKAAREKVKKKSEEILRKVHRELTDKIETEREKKKFAEQNHREKRKKAEEKIQKILMGLKDYEKKVKASTIVVKEKKSKYKPIPPVEKKLKAKATHLSKIAKELAVKIKGVDSKPKKKKNTCDLAASLEQLKTKGILKGKDGKCSVLCSLKPSGQGIEATCNLSGKKDSVGCKKYLYTRSQAVASAVMATFDEYKLCKPTKSAAKTPASELGEAGMPTSMEEGVEVGDYVYSLKKLQDVSGNVNVGNAIEMLLRCNKDGKGDNELDLGQAKGGYSVSNSQKYNGAAGMPETCKLGALKKSFSAILARPEKGCELKCTAGKASVASYTAECTGSGKTECFIAASEQYHRQVISTYHGWKTDCVQWQ